MPFNLLFLIIIVKNAKTRPISQTKPPNKILGRPSRLHHPQVKRRPDCSPQQRKVTRPARQLLLRFTLKNQTAFCWYRITMNIFGQKRRRRPSEAVTLPKKHNIIEERTRLPEGWVEKLSQINSVLYRRNIRN